MAGGGSHPSEWLRALLDSLLDPVVLLAAVRDDDGAIVDFEYLDANTAAVEANRTTYEALVGCRLLELFPEHGRNGMLEVYAQVVETGEPVALNDQPYAHELHQGAVRYFDVRAARVGDGFTLTWRDRTEWHQSRLALESERARTRATLDGLMDPVVLFRPVRDADGTVVDFTFAEVNEAACLYNVTTREELLGDLLSVRYPDMWPLGMFAQFVDVVDGGGVIELDSWPYVSEHVGVTRILDLRGHAVDGGVAVTWRDVTERHHAALLLSESERRFRLLAEQASDVVFVVGPDHRVQWVSSAVTRLLGWQIEDFEGQDATAFLHPDDLAANAERIVAAHAGQEHFAPGEDTGMVQRVRTASGDYRWVRATARPMDGDSGQPGALAVGWHDIDSLVRTREAELRSRLSMDEAAIGLLICDPAGVVTYANEALARMVGTSSTLLLGAGILDDVPPDEARALTAMVDLVLRGESEREHVRRSLSHLVGSPVWVDTFLSPVRDGSGTVDGLMVQVVDVTAEVANREALARSAEHFRLLAENASDVVYETDTHGLITWVSPSVQPALGWDPESLLGTRAIDLVHPGDRDAVEVARAAVYTGTEQRGVVTRFMGVGGGIRHMSVSAHALRDADGLVSGAVVGLHDVTDATRVRAQLERSERTFRTAMIGSPQGMAMATIRDHISDINPALESLLGEDKASILGRQLSEFMVPADPPQPSCADRLIASGEGRIDQHEHLLARRADDGGELWVSHSVSVIRDDDGTALFFVHHLHDVTDRHRRELELGFRASHDPLTGLLNREGLMSRLAEWLPGRGHGVLAILFCDLDGLKRINDEYGHAAGDAVLVAIARRLEGELRRGDIVARLSGDEFIVVLDRIQSEEAAVAVADKTCTAATGPVPFEEVALPGAVSIGVALARADDSPESLIARADEALYRAKQAGRGRVSV